MSTTETMLLENSYIEVKEHLAFMMDKGARLVDSDLDAISNEFGINMQAGAIEFVKKYVGSCDFVVKLQGDLLRKGSLSLPQLRAALNVLKQEIDKGRIDVVRRTHEMHPISTTTVKAEGAVAAPLYVPDTTDPRLFECYTCGSKVRGWANLVHHKDAEHLVDVMDTSKAEKTFLDISPLPDGRYAFQAPVGSTKQFVFLQVKTLVKGSRRDRRFRYGKIVSGREYVPAGTIEVREWSSDTKRLCGMQRPGQGYEGEFVDELVNIMIAPELCAMIFSKFCGVCSICGKTLTDDGTTSGHNSVEMGIGPECYKKYGFEYWKKYLRLAPAIGGLAKP